MGNMYLSSITFPYTSINQKAIQNNDITNEETYYGNYYLLTTNQETESFFARTDIAVPEDEKNKNRVLPDGMSLIYFFVQIPMGYKAYKRDNIQGNVHQQEDIIMVTDNFYYYGNRNNIFYCQIDIRKDSEISSNYVFPFYFRIDSFFNDRLDNNSIKFLYSIN